MEPQKLLAFAKLFHDHARKCRKDLEKCRVCRSSLKFFEELKERDLSFALEDRSVLVHSSAWPTKARKQAQAQGEARA